MATPSDARVRFALLEAAPTAFMALDREWRCLYINPAGAQQLRRAAAELIGANLWEAFPLAVGGTSYMSYAEAMRTRQTVRFEEYYPPLECWFDVSAYAIDLDGETGIGVQFADITERKHLVQQLARSEQMLARAQQIARVGSWYWNIDVDRVQWSAETYRLLAFEDDYRPTTARMEEFVHPDDLARNWEAIQRTLESDAPYDIVLRMRPRDGSTLICHVLGESERDEHGRAVSLFGTVQDITERTRLERAAAQDKRDLERAFRLAHLAGWSWDAAANALVWSEEFLKILGLDSATFVPSVDSIFALAHPDDLSRMREVTTKAVAEGDGYEIQHRMRHAEGSWRHVTSAAEIERDAGGAVVRMLGSIRDRTDEVRLEEERLQLERQLQQAQKLESLGVLAGGIAHDFNNLLVAVLGNASVAIAEPEDAAQTSQLLREIEGAAQQAAALTRQLLAYAGKGRFVVEPCDLSPLVEEMLTLVRAAMSRKAELRLDLAPDLPAIAADVTQMRQVVMNLLTNASDALEDRPGTIVLRTGVRIVDDGWRTRVPSDVPLHAGRYVFLEVSDTGVGMDTETISRVFEPFFTTKFTGRGLGLAATRGIMRGHSGAIDVQSELGKGTTFTLLLPAIDEPAVKRTPVAASTEWRGSGAILVIDDEPTVRRVTRRVLERLGFEVLEAADGLIGLEIFRKERGRIRLTLLDLTMPILDGEETYRQLRLHDPEIRVVLMSGYNAQSVATQFVGQGLAGFIQKPFRADEIAARVRAVLEPS